MYLPQSAWTAFFLMFLTMICWGSWANLKKLDPEWRFELFYWDYAWGVLLCSLFFACTLGSMGHDGPTFARSLHFTAIIPVFKAFMSGAIFNVANILLVAAIALAGMAVAFPVAIGLALVLGTVFSYVVTPIGSVALLSLGVCFILLAIILDALAYKQAEPELRVTGKGILISLISGILMSFFYPIIASSMKGYQSLTPYTALFFFAIGLVICNLIVNTLFMKYPIAGSPVQRDDYFQGSWQNHLWGVLAGVIWCMGTGFNIIASTKAGPAIAYAFGQGATLIAAIWGVLIWKELSYTGHLNKLLSFMFISYFIGLLFIGLAQIQ